MSLSLTLFSFGRDMKKHRVCPDLCWTRLHARRVGKSSALKALVDKSFWSFLATWRSLKESNLLTWCPESH